MEPIADWKYATDTYHVRILSGELEGHTLPIDDIDAGSHVAVLSEFVAGSLSKHPSYGAVDGAMVEIRIKHVVVHPHQVIPVEYRSEVLAEVIHFDVAEVLRSLDDEGLAEILSTLSQRSLDCASGDQTWKTTPEFRQILRSLLALKSHRRSDLRQSLVHVFQSASLRPDLSPAWLLDAFQNHVGRFLAVFVITIEAAQLKRKRTFYIDDLNVDSSGHSIRARVADLLRVHPSMVIVEAFDGVEIDYHHPMTLEVRHNLTAHIDPAAHVQNTLSRLPGELTPFLTGLSQRQLPGGDVWASTSEFASLVAYCLDLSEISVTRGSAGPEDGCAAELAEVLAEAASVSSATPTDVLNHVMAEFQ